MKKRFYKIFLLLTLSICITEYATAQIQDNVINDPGDIAIVGYTNSGSPGAGFAFVLLDNCPPSTVITFSDEEWNGSAFVTTMGEGDIAWTSPATQLSRGTVVRLQSSNANNWPATINVSSGHGAAAYADDGGFNISATGADQLYAFVGTRASRTFITFFGNQSATTVNGSAAAQGSIAGTGLTLGVTAFDPLIAPGFSPSFLYTGPTTCSGTAIACATMIYTASNWNNTSYSFPTGIPTVFTGSVFPVELTSFEGNYTGGGANLLTWTTASERDNKGFDIERSIDGKNFEAIGQIKGNNKPSTYQFMDNQPFATSYYRLKQMDFDGKVSYSAIVSVVRQGKGNGLKVYPTLVTNNVLTVDTEGETRDFSVINLLGQQVLTGTTAAQIDVSVLSKGTYLIKVGTEVAKFVKQ
jgi:hypothetical protein